VTGPIRPIAALAGVAALVCALTACSGSPVAGTPAPATSAPSSSAAQSSTPLAGLSPCATLDKATAGQGFPPATPTLADPEHACSTQKAGYGTIGLNLQDGQSYNTNLGGESNEVRDGTVRNRRAVLSVGFLHTAGSCDVSMEVKPHSRAITSAALTTTTDQACTEARKLAEAVDLLLPAST
jgi:hypothetical protein